ncbi:unnamed protein product [Lupinus luteus]|uniref:Uncharacterized protein n=1 Tax=Lupinus luteus TaxID=3873 RepID=A0AAV1XKI6_LUPLU
MIASNAKITLNKRVDEMVDTWVVDETREFYDHGGNCSNGIGKAIGVPEFHTYFQVEKEPLYDEAYKEKLLQDAIRETKENTFKLATEQHTKIHMLNFELGWGMKIIDSTKVFEAILRGEKYMDLYKKIIFKPSMDIVQRFL